MKKKLVLWLAAAAMLGLSACGDGDSTSDCIEGTTRCNGNGKLETCTKNKLLISDCPEGQLCPSGKTACQKPEPCKDDTKRCTHKGVMLCVGGIWTVSTLCKASQACNPATYACEAPPTDDAFAAIDKAWNDRAATECRSTPHAKRPSAIEPTIPNREREYTIELDRWKIVHNAPDHVQTTDAINAAIKWAHENDYGTVRLPAGQYIVGKLEGDNYAQGIDLPSKIAFILDDNAVIQMVDNDRWNYCAIYVSKKTDVIISGGTIRGDRDGHTHKGGGAHDEGHTICVWAGSERVLIENTTLSHGTGDGVLIVGPAAGLSSKDIIIRNNHIHHQRRQGVSIVGGSNVVIENNEINHISGSEPQFGIDIESMKYKSSDILIRNNYFHANKGGDYVNTDGENVWFEFNICDQTGVDGKQTDGPIVHWLKTDQIIQGNTITVTTGSSNGRWGIIGYSKGERKNPTANYIVGNSLYGGGIHMAQNTRAFVANNTVNDWIILGSELSCLVLDDNKVNYSGREPYKFRTTLGTAQGNLLNGEAYDLPMDPSTPFTNSPPHMW